MFKIIQQSLHCQQISRLVYTFFAIYLTLLAGFILVINSFTGTAQTTSGGLNTSELTRITNIERAKKGQVALTHDSVLAKAAQTRAQHMIDNNYYGHIYNSVGGLEIKEIQNLGYGEPTGFIGENLYANTSNLSTIGLAYNQTVMDEWIKSKPHYNNLMSPDHRIIGFGWAYAPASSSNKYKTIIVAIHANALPPLTAPEPEPIAPAPEPEPELAPAPEPEPEPTSLQPTAQAANPSTQQDENEPELTPEPTPIAPVQSGAVIGQTTTPPTVVAPQTTKQEPTTKIPSTGAGHTFLILLVITTLFGYFIRLKSYSV